MGQQIIILQMSKEEFRKIIQEEVNKASSGNPLQLYSREEAAKELDMSVSKLDKLARYEKIFPIRDGASVKYTREELDRYITEKMGGQKAS